jgi:hypothetical protein
MNALYEALVADKPELIIHEGNLPATVTGLRRVMAAAGDIFDRDGIVVRMVTGSSTGQPIALPLSHHAVVMEAHQHCRPVRTNADGKTIAATLPERVARMYLDSGGWGLPPLVGIATGPLLAGDGAIRTAQGYDPKTGLWCVPSPSLVVPPHPTTDDAKAALAALRQRFRTFPFTDAHMEFEGGLEVVAQDKPPGLAESGFLASLMTAVCRPSLYLAPGLLVNAPLVTGAGSGKGKLVRAIAAIAFGVPPGAVTTGNEKAELDKRLVAELISARPMVFLDNVNGTALRSDLLASILTERPARARVLGLSRMAELNCTAFIAATGNGLSVSEDLARRFLAVDLDPRCEDPEARPFVGNVLAEIRRDRDELLAAVLTVWRWGRQTTIPRGLPLGSYETWAEWCRDPLIALGCADPVQRIRNAKANDPQRRAVADLFGAWWAAHGPKAVKAAELSGAVSSLLDPHKRGRQWIAQRLQQLIGTRGGGFVLTHQPPASGTKTGSTYALRQTEGGT